MSHSTKGHRKRFIPICTVKPANPVFSYRPPDGGLKRGPKPDPMREHATEFLSTVLSEREFEAFEHLRQQFRPKLTRSMFLRLIVCQHLEDKRLKHCPTNSFMDAIRIAIETSPGGKRSVPGYRGW